LWFSHPAGQFFIQFAGYPTVFNNTILKRFVNESKEYPLQTTPKILATTMLMTSVAMLGNYIRTGGRNWETQEPDELVTHAIRRWGGFGALEYFDKTSTNLDLGSGQLGSILKAGGPLTGDIVDALIYRKGMAEFVTTNVPGFSALPKDTRDYLKKIGRDGDKALIEFLLTLVGEETAAPFARGGLVDVPNAKDEPDEMINKFTGLPYNATSTSVQDIEDRERRASGGGVSKIMQGLIERGGEAMGVGASEQRANEKQAAAIVNQMVANGTIPKYEYVEVDDFGFRSGRTGDAFEAVNHGLLSATYGDCIFRRGGLQFKEVGQGFSRPLDSKRDSYNNRVGFKIRETAKTPEAINQEINNRMIRAYEKMGSGEALIPGEDFFLNPNEMEQ